MDPKRRRRWWLALAALVVVVGFLTQLVRWGGDGCPMGGLLEMSVGSNITGSRSIVASTCNLLNEPGLSADKVRATIRLGPRQIVIEGDTAIVDHSSTYAIPPGTGKLEVTLKGKTLRLQADGRDLAPALPR
jgi:hypothetical protein